MKRKWPGWLILALSLVFIQTAVAREFDMNGKPLQVMGYITQGMNVSLSNDEYDTERDIQGLLSNLFLETTFHPHRDVQLFVSGKLTVDWIYEYKSDDSSWKEKGFNDSRSELFFDDEYWQLLNEAHLSWTPGNFFFRFGKQVVSWGQTDAVRILDLWNPTDQRRGFADVEFENSIIPIWLIRAEYYTALGSDWLEEVGVQVIINPNVDFIGDHGVAFGNDAGGVWAYDFRIPGSGPAPNDFTYFGSTVDDIDEPDGMDGMEYGLKLEASFFNTLVSLNAFYGRENSAAFVPAPIAPTFTTAPDGRSVMHMFQKGKYPIHKFFGFSLTRNLPFLSFRIPAVAKFHEPIFRFEGAYSPDRTFKVNDGTLMELDELHYGFSIDYKAKMPWLNPKSSVSMTPQFFHRKVFDYPGAGLELYNKEDTYTFTFFVSTSYLNAKLTPSIFYWYDFNNHASFYKYAVSYAASSHWKYGLGCVIIEGRDGGGFDFFDNKDHLFVSVEYRFD